jgi:hypothetical protein
MWLRDLLWEANVRHNNRLPGWARKSSLTGLFLLAGMVSGWAQDSHATQKAQQTDSVTAAIQDLQAEVRDLRAVVAEMRSEANEYRAQTADLRQELEATRKQLEAFTAASTGRTGAPVPAHAAPRSLAERVASLEESNQLLGDKIDEQYQTKVESASKYRVRLSGIVLLNFFSNRGNTDNQDVPGYALAPSSYNSGNSFGATLRQSEIGLEVFGPRVAGARTMGSLQADFAGGFPNAPNGINSGLFRLRLASMRMDWERTSIVAGQDNLFLSPRAPASFASLAVPAFSYSGDLWAWTPQLRVEHRFDLTSQQYVTLQGGILDNLTGEPPYATYGRNVQAGERSGQPGYGLRVAWTKDVLGRELTLATAGYYSRQNWGYDRRIDGWAGMADWEIPLTRWAEIEGEFYRGRAVGGLGGGIGRSVLFSGNPLDPTSLMRGLDDVGGWSQLKIRASSKLEFNGAFGLDSPYGDDLRAFPGSQSYLDPTLARNRSSLVNFIYRPRSNLLLSTEYRHLRTYHLDNENYPADQVNMMMGILF